MGKDVEVLTTTRIGGFSLSRYASNNLSFDVKDKKELVEKNYQNLFATYGIDKSKLAIISPDNCPIFPIIYARDKNIVIGVLHSDTIPLMFYDSKKNIIGAIQVTTHGVANHVVKDCFSELFKKEKINPKELKIYIGPSLTFSHDIISKKEANKYIKNGFELGVKKTDGVYFLDERFLTLLELRKMKIPMENIVLSPYCTYENNDLLYSKKVEKRTGKNLTFIRFK